MASHASPSSKRSRTGPPRAPLKPQDHTLIDACERGDFAKLLKAVAEGADKNAVDARGRCGTWHAAVMVSELASMAVA